MLWEFEELKLLNATCHHAKTSLACCISPARVPISIVAARYTVALLTRSQMTCVAGPSVKPMISSVSGRVVALINVHCVISASHDAMGRLCRNRSNRVTRPEAQCAVLSVSLNTDLVLIHTAR